MYIAKTNILTNRPYRKLILQALIWLYNNWSFNGNFCFINIDTFKQIEQFLCSKTMFELVGINIILEINIDKIKSYED